MLSPWLGSHEVPWLVFLNLNWVLLTCVSFLLPSTPSTQSVIRVKAGVVITPGVRGTPSWKGGHLSRATQVPTADPGAGMNRGNESWLLFLSCLEARPALCLGFLSVMGRGRIEDLEDHFQLEFSYICNPGSPTLKTLLPALHYRRPPGVPTAPLGKSKSERSYCTHHSAAKFYV